MAVPLKADIGQKRMNKHILLSNSVFEANTLSAEKEYTSG